MGKQFVCWMRKSWISGPNHGEESLMARNERLKVKPLDFGRNF